MVKFKAGETEDLNRFILNEDHFQAWKKYSLKHSNRQKKASEDMTHRKELEKQIQAVVAENKKITNHLELSRTIGNKKALYKTMTAYFKLIKKIPLEDSYVPLTYHITSGLEDEEYLRFLNEFYRKNKEGRNCWIVKPGQMSNRGCGIKYCRNLFEIKEKIKHKQVHANGSAKTFLIQSYLDKPLLYKGRKFDIRHYIMFTSTFGVIRGYFYQGGYIRTTSYKYSAESSNPSVHLTNDAVQKYCKEYGKFEKGNKLSYLQMDKYMLSIGKGGFYEHIFPQIKQISTDILHAGYKFVDPLRKINNFQIFGIDIMIDDYGKCWLIEVNTNPCLELSSPVLIEVIPKMIDNALSISLDSLFPPPQLLGSKFKVSQQNYLAENGFELVFDQTVHGAEIDSIYQKQCLVLQNYGDDDQNYESCEDEDYDY